MRGPLEILLEAINSGTHDGRNIPPYAQSSIDRAILTLATQGQVSPEKLVVIYPNISQLRKMIVATGEIAHQVEDVGFARSLNDFLVMKLCEVPGGDA